MRRVLLAVQHGFRHPGWGVPPAAVRVPRHLGYCMLCCACRDVAAVMRELRIDFEVEKKIEDGLLSGGCVGVLECFGVEHETSDRLVCGLVVD